MDPDTYRRNSFSAYARDSDVMIVRSDSVSDWRTSGGGLSGNNCVGDVSSPGTPDRGTGSSWTGNNDFPVSRSSTKMKPIFVSCTTASFDELPDLSVTRMGAGGLS